MSYIQPDTVGTPEKCTFLLLFFLFYFFTNDILLNMAF
uniref:Uncharacterized protein n=1 Tax=Anguilla anguilla TaxID=7936 RepID=A0A0E9SN18_ANGAN